MKYETPELTALTPAINAIQGKPGTSAYDSSTMQTFHESTGAYADWE
jgi:hypothetical protein